MRAIVADGFTGDAEEAFSQIIAGSHQIATRCDVLFNREVIAEGVPVIGGTVTWDRNQAILASCSVQIADPLRVPVAADDILTPYGYELRLWRGVTVGQGALMAPLGVFPIQRSSVDGTTLLSTITGQDRSKLVTDGVFEDAYSIASGTNQATAIQALIEDSVGGLTFNFPSTTYTTPLSTFTTDLNRWTAGAQKMARSIGNEILFNGLGECEMRAEPTFSSEPVAAFTESKNLLSAVVDLDRGPANNRVIATSSNASLGATYRGVATDDDPSSPTQYNDAKFGEKARFYSSPFLTSDAQCDTAAAAILASNRGVARSVNVGVITDPRIETSDVVQVTREALGLDELHIVDRLTIGLGASDVMTAKVRAQQVAT